MSPTVHRLYVGSLVTVAVLAIVTVLYMGLPYYRTELTERFYHEGHDLWKPSGTIGHGLGILGTLMMLAGVSSYMIRKRVKRFRRVGVLKHWLEFHIFLCTLGPFLVLFHTAFKFGGIVAISFWSMVAVVLSGVIGRFIYIQIPRTIEGRALTLDEVQAMRTDVEEELSSSDRSTELMQILQEEASAATDIEGNVVMRTWRRFLINRRVLRNVRQTLSARDLKREDRKHLLKLVKRDLKLNGRIARLETMKKLFGYWHVAHLPFALIMLIIMVVHVAVTLAFGYRWIF
ncbi:MAG: hypothetical protein R3301_01265 [Saprospiraceae bacterium]|nr:hypothetical protein [Saprospiraceae bacterium]